MEAWVVAAVGFWLVSAILCGFLAPSKGRPSGEWFWMGLLFGVFALAFLALSEPREPSALVHCVHCGKLVDPSRRTLCNNCGEPFAT